MKSVCAISSFGVNWLAPRTVELRCPVSGSVLHLNVLTNMPVVSQIREWDLGCRRDSAITVHVHIRCRVNPCLVATAMSMRVLAHFVNRSLLFTHALCSPLPGCFSLVCYTPHVHPRINHPNHNCPHDS